MYNFKNSTVMNVNLNISNPKAEARIKNLGYNPEKFEDEILSHANSPYNEGPSIYCGTYAKYNNGDLSGMWIDLDSFYDFDDFINFCKAIHADELEPELMFQDYEGFPEEFFSESGMSEWEWEQIQKYITISHRFSKEAADDFIEFKGSIEGFENFYFGRFDSEEDFARNIIEESYNLEHMMGNLEIYFDYAAYARDLFLTDFYFGSNGHIFSRF